MGQYFNVSIAFDRQTNADSASAKKFRIRINPHDYIDS